jgi:hypothetical protein
MNWDAIGAVGEIVGALAVVVSLLYLAGQIRVSNKASRNSLIQELQGTVKIVFQMHLDEAELIIKGMKDFDSLSEVEEMKFHLLFHQSMLDQQRIYYLKQDGEVDEWLYHSWRYDLEKSFAAPGAHAWFEKYSDSIHEDFRIVLRDIIESSSVTDAPYLRSGVGKQSETTQK